MARGRRPGNTTEFMVGGIRVVLTKKRVKNINLRVKAPDGHIEASAPYWVGQEAVAAFVQEKSGWIARKQEALETFAMTAPTEASPEEIQAWRTAVEDAAPALVEKWEAALGVRAGKLAYRNMSSRWGSCNPKTGRICLNIQLAKYPPECLEYIVVHELCHLIERGHGARFKELLGSVMPDWKARRSKLR